MHVKVFFYKKNGGIYPKPLWDNRRWSWASRPPVIPGPAGRQAGGTEKEEERELSSVPDRHVTDGSHLSLRGELKAASPSLSTTP